jgi:uncharacterized tellurite resistance protein B-like protein
MPNPTIQKLAYLFVVLANSDGKITKEESSKISDQLSSYDDHINQIEEILPYVLKAIQEHQEDISSKDSKNNLTTKVDEYCDALKQSLDKNALEKIIHGLEEIAKVDGVIDNEETNWVGIISEKLGLLDDVAEVEDDDSKKGYPVMLWRKMDGLAPEDVSKYVDRWQHPSVFYAYRGGITMLVDECIPQFLDNSTTPVFLQDEIQNISSIMREKKIIPVLSYAPVAFFEHAKRIWWIHPLVIWKEDTASFIFVDKNGIHALYPENGSVSFISPWDRIESVEFEENLSIYDNDDENVNRLTLIYDNGSFLTFDEFISHEVEGNKSSGSYLSIIEDIWNIRYETILASKNSHTWMEGAGGEGFKEFEDPMDLLNEDKWKDEYRPDSTLYGSPTILE